MFKRLELESWHEVLPIIGFALTAAVFLVAIIRALMLHRDKAEELAALPLDLDNEPATRREDNE
jgi:hypothetical protein